MTVREQVLLAVACCLLLGAVIAALLHTYT